MGQKSAKEHRHVSLPSSAEFYCSMDNVAEEALPDRVAVSNSRVYPLRDITAEFLDRWGSNRYRWDLVTDVKARGFGSTNAGLSDAGMFRLELAVQENYEPPEIGLPSLVETDDGCTTTTGTSIGPPRTSLESDDTLKTPPQFIVVKHYDVTKAYTPIEIRLARFVTDTTAEAFASNELYFYTVISRTLRKSHCRVPETYFVSCDNVSERSGCCYVCCGSEMESVVAIGMEDMVASGFVFADKDDHSIEPSLLEPALTYLARLHGAMWGRFNPDTSAPPSGASVSTMDNASCSTGSQYFHPVEKRQPLKDRVQSTRRQGGALPELPPAPLMTIVHRTTKSLEVMCGVGVAKVGLNALLKEWSEYEPTLQRTEVQDALRLIQSRWPHIRARATAALKIPQTFLHGDYHYRNICVHPSTKEICAMDFQNIGSGPAAAELLYFLLTSVDTSHIAHDLPAVRTFLHNSIATYHAALPSVVTEFFRYSESDLIEDTVMFMQHWVGCLVIDFSKSTVAKREAYRSRTAGMKELLEWAERTTRRGLIAVTAMTLEAISPTT